MKLAQLEGTKHFATFPLPDGRILHGEFTLQGANTYVQITADFEFDSGLDGLDPLLAVLADDTKVSFIDNGPVACGMHYSAEGRAYSARLEPHIVILGHLHFDKTRKIKAVSVLTDDAAVIFYDFDTFVFVLNPEEHIGGLIASHEKIVKRSIPRGDRPVVAFFTGKSLIFSASTSIGDISAHHRVSRSLRGPKGVRIDNQIYIDIELTAPTSLREAIDVLLALLRFQELIAGRQQNILHLLASVGAESDGPPLEIYWCLCPKRLEDGPEPRPADLPLNGGIDPDEFGHVISNWLEKDSSRRDARAQFSGCFSKQNRYDIDRLVGAANMFDILPADAFPPEMALSSALSDAQGQARQIFKRLPPSPERDGILGALGRLGHSTLKQKVRHRADILLAATEDRFPDLTLVVDKAINFRNHFVHGSEPKIDFAAHFPDIGPFLTDTLEFVFAASEFVEAGWNINAWAAKPTSRSHPWGHYCFAYAERLSILRTLLARRAAPLSDRQSDTAPL